MQNPRRNAMILYYSPGACSLVAHIALEEAGLSFGTKRILLAEREHDTPAYRRINPHGRVPALRTDRAVITESVAILNFLASTQPAAGSVPLHDSFSAARCNELLSWFASSVHIAFAQIWRAERFAQQETIQSAVQSEGHRIAKSYFAEIERLCGDGWLVGEVFTAADSYLLTFYRWARRIGAPMDRYPSWTSLADRVLERPAVRRVIEREQLSADEFRPALKIRSGYGS